jgi:tripeptidyl-peptidase-1
VKLSCSSVKYKFLLFISGFPATCPYVTAVGATQINPGSNVTQPESACEQAIFSGGGFSNHFAMPAYQQRVVQQYLKKYKPDYSPEVWNSTGIVREIFLLYSD